ncbi:MAG: YfhO family protein, partial [Clostridia bacterium]|nr:YfhO family protein [Clostridia bacterium]
LISYSWNIMWLDVVMVLPICVLGFEKLMREKKHLLYVLTLAYALFSNYYIGFMLCIFLTLYYIAHLVSTDQTAKDAAKGFFRFGFYSVLAGMLAAFVLLPIALSLGHTSAADGGFVDWKTNFDFLDLIGRHLYDVSPTIRSGNMPNIYCGLLAVFLLPIVATLKSIPVKRRGALLGLWAVMALSLTITNFDLFWHGLHSPNDLPYRFSFVYSFSLLLIAYEALIRVKEWQPKQVGFTLCGVIVYIFMEEKFGDGTYSFKSLYLSLAFIVIYAVITLLINNKKLLKEAGYSFLMLVVVGEMLTSSCGSFIKLNQNEYYTAHFDYTDNAITEVTASAVKEMEKLGDAEAGEFYRLEVLPRRTCADTALFDYNGITIFASSNRHEETRFMGSLGYAVNGVNSFLYHFFVPFSDDLLGIRYVAMNDEFTSTKQLKERMNVSLDGNSYTIYENTDALSVGYFVDSNIKSFNYDYYNPFESNNTLGSYMTGNYGSIYEYQQVTAGESGGVSGTYSVSVASGTSDFKVIPSRAGRMYLYVDCRAAENISATMYYNGSNGTQTSNYWSCAPYEPYIIDVGNVDTDDELDVTIEAKSSCGGNVYACILNEPVYNEEIETLKANQMKVTKFTDTKVEGNLIAPRDGCVFTSIPYDEGWTVKVDGKKVKTFAAGNAMLAIDIKAGSHTITMSFFPEGLGLGLTCTILAILILVFLAWIARHPEKTNKAKKKIAMILLNLMKKSEKSSEETEEEDSEKEEPKPAPVKKVKAPKKAEKPEESKKDEETDDWFEE